VPYFNQCGIDGLIVKKRPGKMAIINDQQARELAELVDQPQQAQRSFWTDNSISFQRTTHILIMDNASWHKRKTTSWHNWQPMYCSPIRPTSTL
jgi:hypothetical protein